MARNGHVEAVATCPLLEEERKSLPTFKMTAFDLGCVKTRINQRSAELFSQLPSRNRGRQYN